MACCVLHDIAMKHGVPLPLQPPHQDVRPDPLLGPDNRLGVEVRQQIISHFWFVLSFKYHKLNTWNDTGFSARSLFFKMCIYVFECFWYCGQSRSDFTETPGYPRPHRRWHVHLDGTWGHVQRQAYCRKAEWCQVPLHRGIAWIVDR